MPKACETQIRYTDGYGGIVKIIGDEVTAALRCPIALDRYAKAAYPSDAMSYEIFVWWSGEGKAGAWVRCVSHNRFQELAAIAAKNKFARFDQGRDRL